MPLDLSQPITTIDVKAAVTAEEWEARVELAAFYRLAARHDMTDLGGTHFSMRVPGPKHHFSSIHTACCSKKSPHPTW